MEREISLRIGAEQLQQTLLYTVQILAAFEDGDTRDLISDLTELALILHQECHEEVEEPQQI